MTLWRDCQIWSWFGITEWRGVVKHFSVCDNITSVFSCRFLWHLFSKSVPHHVHPLPVVLRSISSTHLSHFYSASDKQKPTYLKKNVHYLPCEYCLTKKSWIMGEVFKSGFCYWNVSWRQKSDNLCLDNCWTHENVDSVEDLFSYTVVLQLCSLWTRR